MRFCFDSEVKEFIFLLKIFVDKTTPLNTKIKQWYKNSASYQYKLCYCRQGVISKYNSLLQQVQYSLVALKS